MAVDQRVNHIAALANAFAYDEGTASDYVDGAPHIKHAALRRLYAELVLRVFDKAKAHATIPKVLDLGAGEGSVTLPFLELGTRVVAVDISSTQLDSLRVRCSRFADMLEVRCGDIHEYLKDKSASYDIIVANSFLHHVPDYLGMIKEAISLLNAHGQLFFFQDPLRYDTVPFASMLFDKVAYFSWRVRREDVVGGLKRRFRRARGIYLEDSVHDNTEYHVTRNGVDQYAIRKCLEEHDIVCDIVSYFSTQSSFFQRVGTLLRMNNTFAVVAQKRR